MMARSHARASGGGLMQAITYDVRLDTYFLGKAVGARFPELYWGPLSGLRQVNLPTPGLRGDDWAVVDVALAGVCGSDLAAITYKSSPALTPFTSFPSVLGHEIVGRVREAGPGVAHVRPGDRVVVQPFLSCATRGQAVACEACREGLGCLCHRTHAGPLAPGMLMGACRDHHGGWAEAVTAHASQLFALPDDLPDELGVLVEPVSIGVHAVLRRVPPPGARVLVIGSGMMGYAATVALRWLAPEVQIHQATHLPYQRDMARELGAAEVFCQATDGDLTAFVAARTGAEPLRPILGRSVLAGGGYDFIYDCVGTAQSLQDALYFAKPRGTIVLVGAPGELPGLDWTFVWARELTIVGTLGYGLETWQGERLPTFALTMRLMRERPLPLARLITHRFPLTAVDQAMRANLDRARSQALKTVFEPGRKVP